MSEKKEKTALTILLPTDKLKELKITAIKEDLTNAELLEEAFDFYVENKGKEKGKK